jgi:hypothetical protein
VPAAHEAQPGAQILADPGVGRTVPPSDASVGSGEPPASGGEGI